MRKLLPIAIAACACYAPGAAAQMVPGPMPPPGHSWQVGATTGGTVIRHPGPNFPHRRLRRGVVVHPFWFGPQFHIQNWQHYGLSTPPPDCRWIRYYDDAYLIDRGGRVLDTRYGLDWDQYGERWATDDGIPSYYGRGEWRPDERDYAWVGRHRRDDGPDYGARDYGEYGGGGYGPPMAPPAYGPPPGCYPQTPHPCGYGAGYGYGYYGYGFAYPIIIETTVVTGGASYYEVIEEEVVEVRQRQRRHHRPRPRPRPPAGERG